MIGLVIDVSELFHYRTESFDKMGPIGEDPRWDKFGELHAYLLDAFPLVYADFF